ncbi:Cof-type HAD-IIB family hydrolase [Caryophanon tenue]|uniref:Phosphatase n=1 Tax=Caryophanon tenue TaxID=33978 RepID=A0A1C0YK52_9BACL|nr:Cof-type HAD-IIB family hydrolase [Caryophanon tenue]OCS87459.1 phosphatase [Caryophanon tenue]
MTEKHLIVLDLDGTLLTNDKTISHKTKQTIFKAKEAGHEVMIATGRPYRGSSPYYAELGLRTPIVNFNGAFVHHPLSSSWQGFHRPIDLSVVHDVVESVHGYEYENLLAEIKDDVYIHREDRWMTPLYTMGDPIVRIGDLRQNLRDNPTSLLISANDDNVPIIRQHLQDVHAELIEHRRWGAPFPLIEIVRKGLNKAVGIDVVAKDMGIPRERIIAFGDEDNDLEMLEYAGIGVAMGNAIDSVKNIANEITLSNEEDGISAFLQHRLQLERL